MTDVTYATMIYTNGTQSVFGVFAPCRVLSGGTSLDISQAQAVARYEHTGAFPTADDLSDLAQQHATSAYPGWRWPARPGTSRNRHPRSPSAATTPPCRFTRLSPR